MIPKSMRYPVMDLKRPSGALLKFRDSSSQSSQFDPSYILSAFQDFLQSTSFHKLDRHKQRVLSRSIHLFIPVLKAWFLQKQAFNEGSLSEFLDLLKRRKYSASIREKYVGAIRFIANGYLTQLGIVKTPWMAVHSYRRQARINNLADSTRRAIQWFRANGVRIKSAPIYIQENGVVRKSVELVVTNQPLKIRVKETRLSRMVKFLQNVGRSDIREVTVEDCRGYLEKYQKLGQKETVDKDFSELLPVFENLKAGGFIRHNPFIHFQIERQKSKAVIDFISQENMNKILDLSNLDWKDPIKVRNRMICVLLYDLALRKSELQQLRVSDIRIEEDEHVLITIRSEIQKGQGKDEVQFFLFFQESRKILSYYLRKVRPVFKPRAPNFLIGQRGLPLSDSQITDAIERVCKEFEVLTFAGKVPSPHILRHTFATLNIAPIGIALSLNDIVDRLRHVGYETAKKHYVHDNYYLKRKKLEVIQPRDHHLLGRASVQDVCSWLQSIGMNDRVIGEVRHKHELSKAATEVQKEDQDWILESEVVDRLKKFGISLAGIRRFFSKSGNHKIDRRNRQFIHLYPKDMVIQIADHYETPDVIMKTMNIQKSRFYQRIRSFKSIKIGGQLLINKDSIFQAMEK